MVVIERGVIVIYINILCAIYGMLDASLLWYKKVCGNLEHIVFKLNDYDPCVAKKLANEQQHTIRLHVYNVIYSHMNFEVDTTFGGCENETYGK